MTGAVPVILALVAVLLLAGNAVAYAGARRARSFHSTPGQVVKADYRPTLSFRVPMAGRQLVRRVEYKYHVAGRPFRASRISYAMWGESTKRNYYEGDAVTVWYDPTAPHRAVLERTAGTRWPLTALAGVLLAVGLYGLFT